MDLNTLIELDELKSINYGGITPMYLHNDHRYCLPLLYEAQSQNNVPKPINLILFDAHHDLAYPNSELLTKLHQMRLDGFSFEELLLVCKDQLRQDDSDWIYAGMELGMIDNLVSFGVQFDEPDRKPKYEDQTGYEHTLHVLCCTPGQLLGYQGSLSDVARQNELRSLWNLFQWELVPQEGFQFSNERAKIWLNIDLDCFVINWQDYLFPWPDEVFVDRFEIPSDYWSTNGWTGKQFFQKLFETSGLLTIAREPSYCGGEEKTNEVFNKVNHYLFDNSLQIVAFDGR